eukprot:6168285-Prymnesium_polylepis.1
MGRAEHIRELPVHELFVVWCAHLQGQLQVSARRQRVGAVRRPGAGCVPVTRGVVIANNSQPDITYDCIADCHP